LVLSLAGTSKLRKILRQCRLYHAPQMPPWQEMTVHHHLPAGRSGLKVKGNEVLALVAKRDRS
jgi:hypothetical protein